MYQVKKKKRLILFAIVAILISAMIWYYREKLSLFFDHPEKLRKLFLDATQITKVTWKLVLTGVSLSLIAVIIDLIALGWEKSGLRRLIIKPSGSAKIDLWSYFLSVFKIYEVLYFIFTLGIFYFFASIFSKFVDFKLANYISNVYLQFAFVFIVTDFKHYIGHRFMHIKPFWELHAYHHSAEEFNLLTTTRGHLVEAGVYYVFTGFFFAVLGVPIINIFWVYAFREMYQYLLHADVNWKLGFVGKYILISPAAHKLHHSIDEKHYNKNYSTFFIWWDLIFGTYEAPNEEYKIGIIDNPYNKVGFFEGQWIGFKRFLKF
jgi:sterol desaturase/sphingolipid hydroxylase (fatty acid hydroxylase superfamily)